MIVRREVVPIVVVAIVVAARETIVCNHVLRRRFQQIVSLLGDLLAALRVQFLQEKVELIAVVAQFSFQAVGGAGRLDGFPGPQAVDGIVKAFVRKRRPTAELRKLR